MTIHPRDIGTLLIAYAEGAVIYSFQQNGPTKFFQYELPRGAPGGDMDPSSAASVRYPRLTQALWHPSGTFILTVHEDSSFVVWDPKDGRKIQARSLKAANVDSPGAPSSVSGSSRGTFAIAEPLFRVAWCCKENPEDTGILIAGGLASNDPAKGLTFLDLGITPLYSTASWQSLSDHIAKPKKQHLLPTPPNAEVVDFCLIPRKSPHFGGFADPIAIIALLASGELVTLSFPSGHPITPTNQLHVSLSYVHPFINRADMAYVDRVRWLGMVENRQQGPQLLKGGVEAKKSILRYANRNILQTAHADGTIRAWDAGHGDEIENAGALQVDVARAVGRYHDIDIALMSMGGMTGELTVALKTGEVAIFRWGKNHDFGREAPHREVLEFGLEPVIDRADPAVKEGLLPLTLYHREFGPVTALKMSDVGFVCAGFESGNVAVIDLRGPAVIYEVNLSELGGHSSKRTSRFKTNSTGRSSEDWANCIEFGVLSLEDEGQCALLLESPCPLIHIDYSSILLFVGTNAGRVLTFKLLPEASGGYKVSFGGLMHTDETVIALLPVDANNGESAGATQEKLGNLRSGGRINGVLLAVTQAGARIFKPAAAKGAHKAFDQCLCYSANVVRFEAHSHCLVGLFGDGTAKVYSIPGLKEIASTKVDHILDVRRFSECIITPTGFIFGWAGPSEMAVLNVWGTGQDLTRSLDKLFNPDALIPPRPTISHLQWISGTSYVSPADLDKLIGGPDRPPSKRMIEQQRSDEAAKRALDRQNSATSSRQAPDKQQEGYWEYMQRQVQERAENLGLAGDSMDRVEENSQGWASDVNKYVKDQKKKAVMGCKFDPPSSSELAC